MSAPNLSSLPSSGGAVERFTLSAETLDPGIQKLFRAIRTPVPTALTQVAPPQEVAEAIAAALRELGCSYEPRRIVRRIGGEETEVEIGLVHDGGEVRRALLYLEDAILERFHLSHKRLLDELRETLQGDTGGTPFETLYVFHDSRPDDVYGNLMSIEWPDRYGIGTKFLPIAEVSDGFSGRDLQAQVRYLRRELDLDPGRVGPAPRRRPASQIPNGMIVELLDSIARLPQFADSRGRRVFLVNAGLEDLIVVINLEGSPEEVGWRIFRPILKPDAINRLGLLLAYLQTVADLPEEDRQMVDELISGYDFH